MNLTPRNKEERRKTLGMRHTTSVALTGRGGNVRQSGTSTAVGIPTPPPPSTLCFNVVDAIKYTIETMTTMILL